MAISYYSQGEGVRVPSFRRRKVNNWLRTVAGDYGMEVLDVAYQFCDNETILEFNRKYLGHDYYTDVITFGQPQGDLIIADIVISVDQVRINAEDYETDFRTEVMRVMIHGILHMCGLDDGTPEEVTAMRAAEESALAKLPDDLWM